MNRGGATQADRHYKTIRPVASWTSLTLSLTGLIYAWNTSDEGRSTPSISLSQNLMSIDYNSIKICWIIFNKINVLIEEWPAECHTSLQNVYFYTIFQSSKHQGEIFPVFCLLKDEKMQEAKHRRIPARNIKCLYLWTFTGAETTHGKSSPRNYRWEETAGTPEDKLGPEV